VRDTAVSPAGEQLRPAGVSARERRSDSAVQCVPWSADWVRVPPRSSASIRPPLGTAASASGTPARPGCSGPPGCQVVPLSRVAVSAENVRSTPDRFTGDYALHAVLVRLAGRKVPDTCPDFYYMLS